MQPLTNHSIHADGRYIAPDEREFSSVESALSYVRGGADECDKQPLLDGGGDQRVVEMGAEEPMYMIGYKDTALGWMALILVGTTSIGWVTPSLYPHRHPHCSPFPSGVRW